MADSENKTFHFQYKILCKNANVTAIGITHWIIIYVIIDIVMSDGKGSINNKFELDRRDHDTHANRAEQYLV